MDHTLSQATMVFVLNVGFFCADQRSGASHALISNAKCVFNILYVQQIQIRTYVSRDMGNQLGIYVCC